MSKYFDGYASFDYKEMSKEKLITELKEKVRYIGELKRNNNEEIAKVQSVKDKKIADLETKLAEKDSEIEILNVRITTMQEDIDYWEKQLAESENLLKDIAKNEKSFSNQDKIEFAIAELEKVKEFLINSVAWWGYKSDGVSPTEFIDNQIKEIKEMK